MQICEIWGCITLKDRHELTCNGNTFKVRDSNEITEYPIKDFFDFIKGHEIVSISGNELEDETVLLCIDTEGTEHAFNTTEQAVIGLKLLRLTQPPKVLGK